MEFGSGFIADKWAVVIPALAQDIRLPGAHRGDEGLQVPPGAAGQGGKQVQDPAAGAQGISAPGAGKGDTGQELPFGYGREIPARF